MKTYSSYTGDNSDLVKEIGDMYLSDGDKIADVTFGKGVFWKKTDMSKYDFFPSDLLTCPDSAYDFTDLPYEDEVFDTVVFDPPYVHNPGRMIVEANYRNAETTKGMYHNDIINLYKKGMEEAHRILKTEGFMWVKCKDEVESGYNRWSHLEIYDVALKMGFFAKDLFIMTQKNKPYIQHANQKHARKNHSYMWIFQKASVRQQKAIRKHGILK